MQVMRLTTSGAAAGVLSGGEPTANLPSTCDSPGKGKTPKKRANLKVRCAGHAVVQSRVWGSHAHAANGCIIARGMHSFRHAQHGVVVLSFGIFVIFSPPLSFTNIPVQKLMTVLRMV